MKKPIDETQEKINSWWGNLGKITQDVIRMELELTSEEKKNRNIWKNPYENYEMLRGVKYISSMAFTPSIQDLKKIKKFDCYGTNISTLPNLSKFIDLEELFLGGTFIKDIHEVKKMPSIQKMCLYNSSIEDFLPIESLHSLKRICLSNTSISDLSPLSKLKDLEVIIFYSTKVTSLHPLANLKKLKRIRCHNTPLSSVEVNKFKNEHPECEIITDANAFDEGFDDFTN